MALHHINPEDELERKKHLEDFASSMFGDISKMSNQEISDMFSTFDGDDVELDPEPKTIGLFLKQIEDAARSKKGKTNIFLVGAKDENGLKPIDFTLQDDDIAIHLDIDKSFQISAIDFSKTIKNALAKLHLKSNAGYKFMFRGNLLKIEEIVLIGHGKEDDDATLMVSFEQDAISAKKTTISQCLKAKDLLNAMQVFFDEQMPYYQEYCNELKVVCVSEDDNVQNVFQLMYPKISGNQLVFNVEKCSSWRFREIAGDPATINVKQLKKLLTPIAAKNGYVFMKGKGQTYGVVSIDTIDSDAYSENGPHQMLALVISPWEDLNERHKMKKKQYTRKQIIESIAYWKKQLKLGNYINESSFTDLRHGRTYNIEHNFDYFVDVVLKDTDMKDFDGLCQKILDILYEKEDGLEYYEAGYLAVLKVIKKPTPEFKREVLKILNDNINSIIFEIKANRKAKNNVLKDKLIEKFQDIVVKKLKGQVHYIGSRMTWATWEVE